MMRNTSIHSSRLFIVVAVVAWVLVVKVFIGILYEYRWYFPADFSSEFLHGREATFHGLYRAAFYAHIIVAPLTLLAALFLLISGRRLLQLKNRRPSVLHHWTGRLQGLLILFVVAPSGLIMALRAFGGMVATVGLAALSLATAASVILAIHSARRGQLLRHRGWAVRSSLLLASPLLLRLMSGVVLVTQLEPTRWYCINVWLSWLIPLGSYELWRRRISGFDLSWFSHSKNEALQ